MRVKSNLTIKELEDSSIYYSKFPKTNMSWDDKFPAIGADVEIRIRLTLTLHQGEIDRLLVGLIAPEIQFSERLDEDMKIILYVRLLQAYGKVFFDAIQEVRPNFVENADELVQNILLGRAFWNRLKERCQRIAKKYHVVIGISLDDYLLDEQKIKEGEEQNQRRWIHSKLARVCPWCQKYFIPSGAQAYKQIYCKEAHKKQAKSRRKYLRNKPALSEEEKKELERLTVQPEISTNLEWEGKIRQVLRELGFLDNHGWRPSYKTEEVEILEEQLKK